MDDIYGEYGGYFYVPMTQAFSLAIPVTIGCSWNKCLYCDLNHDNKFRKLALEEIKSHILRLKELNASRRSPVEKVVLAGGNPFCLDTPSLINIIKLVKEHFPEVKNISSFARADDVLRKSDDELLELKSNSMGELSLGIESGNDEILAFHNKGVTVEENNKAMAKLEELNIGYSTYIMLGLGGKTWSKKSATDTGKMLSNFNPQVITLVSLVLFKDAKLIEKVKTREFIKLKPLEYILEERLLLENLNMRNTIFNGTHKTNTLILKGKLPEHKELLLKRIDEFLESNDDRDLRDFEKHKWRRWSIE
ncbi:radical SAM protein [Tissierella creatinini]|nr:radical SAM protein [Tissierella creatinini]TJX66338.1 radical SAM protein [Soehngenia saccharolytica]